MTMGGTALADPDSRPEWKTDYRPSRLQGNQGIKLSRVFPYTPQGGRRSQTEQKTDYYFWNLADFSSELSFICERKQLDIGCIEVLQPARVWQPLPQGNAP